MNEFTFKVVQGAYTSFVGEITIEAISKAQAKKKIMHMTQQQLEEKCTNWEVSDQATEDGPIEVYDNNGMMINEI